MAHVLTEVDDFTTDITVPDGTDSRNDAAEVVEAIAQGLANRTKALNEHAAFFDVANDFTEPNTFDETILAHDGVGVDSAAAASPALTVFTSADDDPHSGNKWKKLIQALIGGGLADAMMWSGIPTHDAQLLFTINARWDATTQRWIQQDGSRHSSALLMDYSGVFTFSRVTAGASPWATWPVTGTSTNVRAEAFTATGSVNAGNDVTATDDLIAGDDVSAGGDFLYTTPRNEFRSVDLTTGFSSGTLPAVSGTTSISYFDGDRWVIGDRGSVSIPILAPVGGVLKSTRLIISNPSGSDDTVYNVSLVRAHGVSFGSATPPTISTVDSEIDTVHATEVKTVSLDWGSLTVAADEWYYVYLSGLTSPTTVHALRGVQYECTRLGPSQ